jgi:beta-1,2-mannosidase
MKKFFFVAFVIAVEGCSNGTGTAASRVPLADSAAAGSAAVADSAAVDTGWAFIPFTKVDSVNPVLVPGGATFVDPLRRDLVKWEEKDVFNPAIAVRNGKLYLLYRAQDKTGKPAGTSRIGLAVSDDGYHFRRRPAPVLYPAADAQKKLEWEGGCEDPRVVQDQGGIYYMTYTAFDGQTARLMVATSSDLVHWIKHGSVFADAYNGKYSRTWSKSGSIASHYLGGRVVAAKINGKYWMYWGDHDIWAATSEDLIHWTPVEGDGLAGSALKIVLAPRSGHWDSQLVESGPPAMITKAGILLIYNGMNERVGGDSTLPEGMYGGGQVLLDANDPTKVLRRLDHNFIHPDKPYEITGQVGQVCFLEGLADFKGRWLLYYGTADSKIAVAVGPDKPMAW